MRKLFTKQNALLYGGYTVFFFTCFVLFAFLTFPYERVKGTVEQLAAQGSPGVETKLTIGDIGPSFLTGIAMRDVVYDRKNAGDAEPVKVAFDTVKLSVSPLSIFTRQVNFSAEAGGGEIDGQFSRGGEGGTTHFQAELDAVDLGKV